MSRSGPEPLVAGLSERAAADRGLFATALARAEAFLLEPAEPAEPDAAPASAGWRPLVVVAGVTAGCGATTVARALSAELALRDPGRAAAVLGEDIRGGLPVGTPAAGRLSRLVSQHTGVGVRPSGRLCLAEPVDPPVIDRTLRGLAAIVFDGQAATAGPACSIADHVVLVATPTVEPALATIVAGSLARVGPEPIVVLNRGEPQHAPASWRDRAHAVLPDSRAGARLALAGRGAGGAFGAGIMALADRCGTP